MSNVTIGDIERAIARRFPPQRAEAWDRVGLLAGDPERAVTGVVLALDPTIAAIESAAGLDANVLVTHHPAFLDPPHGPLRPGPGPEGVLFAALDAGVALVNAHTNLDRDAAAQRLLPDLLGLTPLAPLEQALMPMTIVTAYAPAEAADAVTAAMTAAGAGRIGDYEGCSFSATGVGAFTPAQDARPCSGTPSEHSQAEEVRIEMVAPRPLARSVAAAAVLAHPYEEPLVTVADVVIARNAARIGMLCAPATPIALRELTEHAGSVFGVTPRIWGDPNVIVTRIATSTGSAGSLIADALAERADVLLAGEVRYHDALGARDAGLCVIELGHDVSEWPLVGLLEAVVRTIPGLRDDQIHVLPPQPAWWTS
jgi:putative NIF3 family GTP cyclohydrolase 1 type 2